MFAFPDLAVTLRMLVEAERDGLLVTRLDEVAWLTNLRGYEIDYSATFRSLAWVGRDEALLFVGWSVWHEPFGERKQSFDEAWDG